MEDSDQTAQMRRLIWDFTGPTCHFDGFIVLRLRWHIFAVIITAMSVKIYVFSKCPSLGYKMTDHVLYLRILEPVLGKMYDKNSNMIMSLGTEKRYKWYMLLANTCTQFTLHTSAVWTDTSLGTYRVIKDPYAKAAKLFILTEYAGWWESLLYVHLFIFELPHDKTNKMACAPSENSDQPGHPPSLIRVFTVRMKKAWILSYPLSTQQRLWWLKF